MYLLPSLFPNGDLCNICSAKPDTADISLWYIASDNISLNVVSKPYASAVSIYRSPGSRYTSIRRRWNGNLFTSLGSVWIDGMTRDEFWRRSGDFFVWFWWKCEIWRRVFDQEMGRMREKGWMAGIWWTKFKWMGIYFEVWSSQKWRLLSWNS